MRNEAFFRSLENTFLTLKRELGEEKALDLFAKIMQADLGPAYEKEGFEQGNPQDFERVVGRRDAAVGLRVEFPLVSGNKIIYRFLDDPFPGLKGQVEAGRLVETYLGFKVQFLLGKGWTWRTTRHFWKGDACNEHVIERVPA